MRVRISFLGPEEIPRVQRIATWNALSSLMCRLGTRLHHQLIFVLPSRGLGQNGRSRLSGKRSLLKQLIASNGSIPTAVCLHSHNVLPASLDSVLYRIY